MENDILLPEICGNRSKEDVFWSYSLTWNTTNPDFTECFQNTVLIWVPCAVLLLGVPFYLFHLFDHNRVHKWSSFTKLGITKLVFCVLLIVVSAVVFVKSLADLNSQTPSQYVISATVMLVSMILVCWLMRYEFTKGAYSSGLVTVYWSLHVICGIVPFRSKIMKATERGTVDDMFGFVTFYVYYGVLLVQFILHLFPDAKTSETTGLYEYGEESERQPLLRKESEIIVAAIDKTKYKPCPEQSSSFVSRITYSWVFSMLILGYKHQLTGDKLWLLKAVDQAQVLIQRFKNAWRHTKIKGRRRSVVSYKYYVSDGTTGNGVSGVEEIEATPPEHIESSLFRALARSFGWYYALIGIYEACNIGITFLRPLLLDLLIGFVQSNDQVVWRGYLYAVLMFVLTMFRAVINNQHMYGKMITGLRIRSALTGAIYRKSLRLSTSSRAKYSLGEIVNLMSVDAQRLADVTSFIHYMWSAPVSVVIAMVMLWNYLGPASLTGLAVLLVVMGLNAYLARRIKRIQIVIMKIKDARLKLTNEVLNGIKVLKLYAWEGAFQKKLDDIRVREVALLRKVAFLVAGAMISFTCAPLLYSVTSFAVFVLASPDNIFTAQVAFVSLSLVNSLTRPLTFLPNGIANLAQASVSMKRVETFLNDDELDPNSVQRTGVGENAVSVQDGTFTWDSEGTPVLRHIDVNIPRGSLTAVVGQVGSGKSTLLSAMLGELTKLKGTVNVEGNIAYVPQETWIRNEMLVDNVLFGKPMNERKYKATIEACALTPDLKILPGGDKTEIGEKGINLSGGQKQRVSLARAVYNDADVYLIDDALSAVDAHVGKHIFDKVIGPKGVLKHKTRVLVTHGITHLPKTDQIIVMKNGVVSERGTYRELLSRNGAFADFLRTYLNEDQGEEDETDPEVAQFKQEVRRQISALSGEESIASDSDHSGSSGRPRRRRKPSNTKDEPKAVDQKSAPNAKKDAGGDTKGGRRGKLTDFERSKTGGVNWRIMWIYLKCMGPALIGVLAAYVVYLASELGSNIWLSVWSEDKVINGSQDISLTNLRLGVYGGIGGAQTFGMLFQTISLAIACTTASQVLHKLLLARIIRAPMSFFDTTPTGRILNRFSQDMSIIDFNIRFTINAILRGFSGILTTLIAISYSTPIFVALVVPLALVYLFIQRFYVATSNQLRRLNSTRTSPIYSHFGETVSGASSVRAYRQQDRFIQQSDKLLDEMQMAKFANIATNRWLGVWLEFLGAFIVLFAAVLAVISRDTLTGGLVGLSVSYSLQVTDRLAFFLRNSSDLESNIVSVERISEYMEVPNEDDWIKPNNRPPRDWPDKGRVSFNQYSTRYREGLDLVLKAVSFDTKEGEKIGIVGRTGAGKSSITLGLFRIIEAAAGGIQIDDVKIGGIGLHDLRSKLTIIPQDPVLFSGSLRMNLDPFDTHTDDQVWQALEHAHLKEYVRTLNGQLEFECQEGGSNLSVGQKQLVCLARALLRKTKILVLDEATASVDLETDDLIQTTIRSEFRDCTVITIAHRLNTVMDYDRIMLLDQGQLQEYDSPSTLLANKGGVFYSMARDAGLV